MILRELGYDVLTSFLRAVMTGEVVLIDCTMEDLERATALLEKYADSRVDFVDRVIAAMAERMNITRILAETNRFSPTEG